MIPGELFIKDGEIELNAGRKTVTLTVANTGDRPIQVGSHYHFFETNPALKFDRKKARGMRLDIAAGTAVRFEPGQTRDVQLVALAGKTRHLRLPRRRDGEVVSDARPSLVSEAAELRAPSQWHGAQGARQRALHQSSRRGREPALDATEVRMPSCRAGWLHDTIEDTEPRARNWRRILERVAARRRMTDDMTCRRPSAAVQVVDAAQIAGAS